MKCAISGSREGREHAELLGEHQNLVLTMLSTIERQKQAQQGAISEFLLSRIDVVTKERRFGGGQGEMGGHQIQRKPRRDKPRQRVVVLTKEELERGKELILEKKEKCNQLLKEIGVAERSEDSKEVKTVVSDDRLLKERILGLRHRKKEQPKKRPIQKFRGLARVVAAFFILQKYSKVNVEKRKEGMLSFMKHDIDLHLEISRAWLLSCAKPVLLSVTLRSPLDPQRPRKQPQYSRRQCHSHKGNTRLCKSQRHTQLSP